MFVPDMEPHVVRKNVDEIQQRAAGHGRDPRSIKAVAGILVVVDETDELACAKYEEYLPYADLEGSLALFGGRPSGNLSKLDDDEDFRFTGPGAIQIVIESWSSTIPDSDGVKWIKSRVAKELALGGPHAKAIGSPTNVADILER